MIGKVVNKHNKMILKSQILTLITKKAPNLPAQTAHFSPAYHQMWGVEGRAWDQQNRVLGLRKEVRWKNVEKEVQHCDCLSAAWRVHMVAQGLKGEHWETSNSGDKTAPP